MRERGSEDKEKKGDRPIDDNKKSRLLVNIMDLCTDLCHSEVLNHFDLVPCDRTD